MSAWHLYTADDDVLCRTTARVLHTTAWHADVSCLRCQRVLEHARFEYPRLIAERRHEERNRAAMAAVGMGAIYDFLSSQKGDSAALSMVSGILGSVAVYLQESGYQAPAEQAAA